MTENIDTTTASGRLIFHVFGALAEFERELILERSWAGTAAARARGRMAGRPTVMTSDKATAARALAGRRELLTDDAGPRSSYRPAPTER